MRQPFSRCFRNLAVLAAGAVVGLAPTVVHAQPNERPQVILISIDGLTTMDYLHPDDGLKVPNLQALRANGCAADGMTGIFPTVTYPSHTAMITGEPSSVHGIHTNTPLDPFGYENGGWFYYAEQIRSPTLWQVLNRAGRTTAAVSWPVTVGAEVDYLLPEYRPVRTPEDVALMSALSTRGLFREMIGVDSTDRPMTDPWRIQASIAILNTRHPDLLALHLSDLDGAQHGFGPHTPQAHAALEKIDAQIGELRAAVAASGRADRTAWVVVSDHGFYPVSKQVNPMIALRDAGLITVNASGRVTDWKVFMHNEGGSAFFEARDPADSASIAKAAALLRALAADPANGIRRVYTPRDLAAEHADPDAFLALETERGFGFGSAFDGPMLTPSTSLGQARLQPGHPRAAPCHDPVGPRRAAVPAARGRSDRGCGADGRGAAGRLHVRRHGTERQHARAQVIDRL